MADTGEVAKYGVVAVGLYLGYKAMSGVGSTAVAPFEFAGGMIEGLGNAGGSLFGGAIDTADGVGGFVGDMVTGTTGAIRDGFDFGAGGAADIIKAPGNVAGDLYSGGQDIASGIGNAVSNVEVPKIKAPW